MRKLAKYICVLMLLTACTKEIASTPPLSKPSSESMAAPLPQNSVSSVPESAAAIEASEESVPMESSEVNIYNKLPSLPDFNNMSMKELPFNPSELWGENLTIQYKATVPSVDFLASLNQLAEDDFVSLTSAGNFFNINNYIIYFTMDSPMGQSKIVVESLNGESQTVLQSTFAIWNIFFVDKVTLCIEFAELVHYEGGAGKYYFFELPTAKVSPAPYKDTSSGHSLFHKIYRKHHYLFENAKAAMELGEAYDISIQDENGDFSEIIEYAASPYFSGEAIYYLSKGGREIFCCDLLGNNKKLFYTCDDEIWSFEVKQDSIIYSNKDGAYITDLTDNTTKPYDSRQSASSDGKEYYAITPDNILEHISADGDRTPLLANFNATLEAVNGDWIYFSTYKSGEINRYGYWKIKKDGSELTPLN